MTSLKEAARRRLEDIMLGKRAAGLLYPPLAAASLAYSAATRARNSLYDAGLLTPEKAPCRIVSVGGLTLGGAGKTPLAIHIARRVMANQRTAILSRGYGQRAREDVLVVSDGKNLCAPPPHSADEPYMMAKKLAGVPVVTAPRRIDGARKLVESFGTQTIILDDGFGHRGLHRDVDIVIVDRHALDPSRRTLFPLGYLREPPESLERADAVVIMENDDTKAHFREENEETIRKLAGKDLPVFHARGAITGFMDQDGTIHKSLDGPAVAFCGVAAPERFKASLERMNIQLADLIPFQDHHMFTEEDIALLNQASSKAGAQCLVTTEKDAVRLDGRTQLFDKPLYAAVWELKLDRDIVETLGLK